jgi:hypothetical protein
MATALVTFGVGVWLKGVRQTPLFNKPTREVIADFAPTLGRWRWAEPVSLDNRVRHLLLTTIYTERALQQAHKGGHYRLRTHTR